MSEQEELVHQLLASINRQLATMPPELTAALTKIKSEIDGWSVDLREAGMPTTMIGALLYDSALHRYELDRLAALTYCLAVLK